MAASSAVTAVEKSVPKTTEKKWWTNEEILTMINYIKLNSTTLFGTSGGHGVEGRKRKAWKEVAEKVAEAGSGGDTRSGENVRKKWQDISYRAKKYRTKRQGKTVTGGGPQPAVNEVYEAVLDALPDVISSGILPASKSLETIPGTVSASTTNRQEQTPAKAEDMGESSVAQAVGNVNIEHPSLLLQDTETESSQASETNYHCQPKMKKRKSEHKKKTEKKSSSSETKSLLELNTKMFEAEERKMILREEKIKIQRELVEVLKSINTNIQRLIPPIAPFDLGLLQSVQQLEQ